MLKPIALSLGAALAVAASALADTPATATADLNIRSGPGLQFRVTSVINAKANVKVIGCLAASKWCRVDHRGVVGWSDSDYLITEFRGAFDVREARIVTYALTPPTLFGALQEQTLRSPDPSRPRGCAKYVIDPEDDCY